MIECWQGKETPEEQLRADWGDPPYTLKFHAAERLGRFDQLDPDDLKNVLYLRQRLSSRWLIVTLVPRPPGRVHAVVLIEATPTGFRYLDPDEPSDKQPLEILEDDFVRTWTGEVVIADEPRLKLP